MSDDVGSKVEVNTSCDDVGFEVFTAVMMYLVGFALAVFIVWYAASKIPTFSYHEHSTDCYNQSGDLICMREEGELVLKESKIPSPIEVIAELDRISQQ